jgi:hypothetical protein
VLDEDEEIIENADNGRAKTSRFSILWLNKY